MSTSVPVVHGIEPCPLVNVLLIAVKTVSHSECPRLHILHLVCPSLQLPMSCMHSEFFIVHNSFYVLHVHCKYFSQYMYVFVSGLHYTCPQCAIDYTY